MKALLLLLVLGSVALGTAGAQNATGGAAAAGSQREHCRTLPEDGSSAARRPQVQGNSSHRSPPLAPPERRLPGHHPRYHRTGQLLGRGLPHRVQGKVLKGAPREGAAGMPAKSNSWLLVQPGAGAEKTTDLLGCRCRSGASRMRPTTRPFRPATARACRRCECRPKALASEPATAPPLDAHRLLRGTGCGPPSACCLLN